MTTQVTTRLNLQKYNTKRIAIEEQITALKELVQTPGRGGSSREYFTLENLQYQATILYMARAEQRSKLHALVRVSYRRDPTASPYGNTEIIDGVLTQLNVMAKVIDPVTREEQQKAIASERLPGGLLEDLYREVPVIVRPIGDEAPSLLEETVHDAANRGDPVAIKAVLGGG